MTATVRINNRSFLASLGLFQNRFRGNINRALDVVAQVATKRIEERTDDGKQINGSSFASYTREYEIFKRKAQGVKFRGVNLQLTNDMLRSMTNTRPQNGKVRIFFAGKGESKISNAEKAALNQVKRPFFGLNREDEKILRNVFSREVFK